MQFYSDYSSEEERDDYEVDLWNPNELIDEILAVEDEEEKFKLKKALLQKFLDQERPLLTSKMKDFFLEEGVTENLIGFVNRVNPDEEAPVNPPTEASIMTPLKTRPNIPEDEDEVKRSFNVMEIFVNPMHDLAAFLPEKLHVILRELFKIFKPNSKGNFYHFNKIIEHLLVRTPSATTRALLSEGALWTMLDFLHETPIIDTLIEIFCVGFPRQSDTIQFYKALVDGKMFDRIGEKIFGKPSAIAPHVAEFFIKLMEKLSSIEMSGILFISLCRTSAFIDGLFGVIFAEKTYPAAQRQACANVLRELLLKSGQKVFEPIDITKPLPNMLSAIHDKLHDYAKVHVPELCKILIHQDSRKSDPAFELQSYTIKRPFTFYRLMLTDILSDLLVCTPEVLDNVPTGTWRVLSSWFLEYRFNNLYHFHFWKVYQLIIRDNHVESQRHLFTKYKFATKMIEHYLSKEPSGNRGFIIVMCNTLRFASELQPTNGYLRTHLNCLDIWKNFLPTLRAETALQQKRYDDLIFMPDAEDEDEEEGGIDLGSAYARSLGFDELPPPPINESPSKTQRKKAKRKAKKSDSMTNLGSSSEEPKADSGKSEGLPVQEVTDLVKSPKSESKEGNSLDWWKDMVEDFKKDEEPTTGDHDWWQELKDELQTISEDDKPVAQEAKA